MCDLGVFYHRMRRGLCWKGSERKWRFESIGECVDTEKPKDLSRPNAGERALIHALSISLGLDD